MASSALNNQDIEGAIKQGKGSINADEGYENEKRNGSIAT